MATALRGAAEAVAGVIAGHTPEARLAATAAAARPAVMDLVFGTLRDHGRGDFLLGRLLEKQLKDALVHALLLVALFRLEQRPADAHTTVDQAVQAAAGIAGGRLKALVNGVLRSYLRRREELLAAAAGDEVAHWRHQHWWIERLRTEQPQAWQDVLAAGNSHPPMSLRVNRRRAASADFLGELAAAGIDGRALDDTAIRLDKPVAVERLPGFADGRVSVQDWGAQQAARLLDLRDGQHVLDACAAPGGKAAHILELADVELTALELDPERAGRVRDNLARLGLRAEVRVADCRRLDDWWDGRPFERILADVPCSASGVARRHPDIKWLRRTADVARFAQAQAAILDALWRVLAPGGTMLYCTCSVFRAENAAQIEAFAARHADARRLPTHSPTHATTGTDEELQLLPGPDHDGFYYALLQKLA
ncbi:MAG: 16S rRNA (cytosine(967)-C(5))-methyltransferase RsmB [Gammaproteobacteria bacterium]|nr:16S rRNA (cytosine(967)-C(5))-methyltransferase RsmB [Gammaproteobacteria bacterium]MBU1644898.1 16S rRNA (cytosine(967)-C(5))-methyltransferase RsmB [Gammaproteobacteria bacterium]MBU1971357.1 16S rRNA (cytosine(967)-C(5))-methyltransferase RsmB [Gammaproteobacteria bacterium]